MTRYQKRISGPLLDRIDIFVDVPPIEYGKLAEIVSGESSESVRLRVERARQRQIDRFAGTRLLCNAEMNAPEVKDFCQMESGCSRLLKTAMDQLCLSARSFHRIIKLSRTIADVDGEPVVRTHHLAEALQYRQRES